MARRAKKRKGKRYDVYHRAGLRCPVCGRSNFLTGKGLAKHQAKCRASWKGPRITVDKKLARKGWKAPVRGSKKRKVTKPRRSKRAKATVDFPNYMPKHIYSPISYSRDERRRRR